MKKLVVAAVAAVVGWQVGAAVVWKNLDKEHHLGGRVTSEGYMRGKVALVCRWGLKFQKCRTMLPKLEEVWQAFKSKPLVVLCGHCKGYGEAEEIRKFVTEQGISCPVYEGGCLAAGEPSYSTVPVLYVVDETGRVVYAGHNEQTARQALVTALTDMEAPRSLVQWKRFLDFELQNLPGRAWLRVEEFRKKFPNESKEYAVQFKELAAVPDVRTLAALVSVAREAKDHPDFGPKEQMKKAKHKKSMEDALRKYASLKQSSDPRVAQEAKNALADIKWALADF